ncbi:helix-turn-helix transcriptional regulator, partial [Aliidongia dinghuensis]|uniref:helix-turn-helix transcriptional regulator n=1 Tax=Aliidongia dinghuensis TaxID=1867774 RepID=UPI001E2D9D08
NQHPPTTRSHPGAGSLPTAASRGSILDTDHPSAGVNFPRRITTEISYRLGRRIKVLRESAGLTQTELASRLGKGTSSISQIERGLVLPSISTVEAIANAVGCGIDQVFSPEIRAAAGAAAAEDAVIPRVHLLSSKDRKLVRAMVDRLLDGDG